MNEFDQFMKHKFRAKYYIRYADDFVILSDSRPELLNMMRPIREFLNDELKLGLHPKKISISTVASGVDFLGWVSFTDHRILRTATKRRMFKKIEQNKREEAKASYLGMLSHGNAHKLKGQIYKYMLL